MRKFLILVTFIFVFASANANEPLIFSTGQEVTIQQISIEVLSEAYQKIGYDIEIKRLPSARALLTANNGMVDGEVSRIEGIDKQFSHLIRVPIAINHLEGYAFAKRTDIWIENW